MLSWDRIAALIDRRPALVLASALVPLLLPLLALPGLRSDHDVLSALPQSAEAVMGYKALEPHIPEGESSPLLVVIDHDQPLDGPDGLAALATLTTELRGLPEVSAVRSASHPTDGIAPALPEHSRAGLEDLLDRLGGAGAAAAEIARSAGSVHVPAADDLVAALATGDPDRGDDLSATADAARDLEALARGLAEELLAVRDDAIETPVEAADDTATRLADAVIDLEEIFADIGEAAQKAADAAGGLADGFAQLATGAEDSRDGLREALAPALAAAGGSQAPPSALGRLAESASEQLDAISGGFDELAGAADDLAAEFDKAGAQLDAFDEHAATGDDGQWAVTGDLVSEYPEIRDELGMFLTGDGQRSRMFVGIVGSPYGEEAIPAVEAIREAVPAGLSAAGLDADTHLTGAASFLTETDEAAARDFPVIIVAVLLGVFVVLVALLRSLVAPLYMVASVLLSYGAALGVTAFVLQDMLGHAGLQWWLPPLLFVMLVALGVDYNIFLMSRVREEARRMPVADAVGVAVRHTGKVITSAGVILAGTFGVLIAAPLSSLAQLGFAAMIGILLDTFIVRALVVPSIARLLGRWNWWPARPPDGQPASRREPALT